MFEYLLVILIIIFDKITKNILISYPIAFLQTFPDSIKILPSPEPKSNTTSFFFISERFIISLIIFLGVVTKGAPKKKDRDKASGKRANAKIIKTTKSSIILVST